MKYLKDQTYIDADDASDVATSVGDLVLNEQKFQKILPRHRHEQALRQMEADLFLEIVCLVFEALDVLVRVLDGVPVTIDRRREQHTQLLRTVVSDGDMFLQRLYR